MQLQSRLLEQIKWVPVHGASILVQSDGLLMLRDGPALDWHLLRWTDIRLNGATLGLDASGGLPDIEGMPVSAGIVTFAAATITFLRVPAAVNSGCRGPA